MVKSSKAFYSSKFPEYILSNEQIDKLHDVLFGMLKDRWKTSKSICKNSQSKGKYNCI